MTDVPKEMRAIALSKYSTPSEYDVATLPTPKITEPNQILIKVHAASINPIDVKTAAGQLKQIVPSSFPAKIGEDGAGTVVAVGEGVKNFKVGDEIYTRVPPIGYTGVVAEYALSTEEATSAKPPSLTFTEAASVPLATLTSYQALKKADAKLGGLKGKTVFIPGGLSATGVAGVQLAKNIFQAGKVITSLSTGKIDGYEKYIGPNVVDQVVDYRTQDVVKTIGTGTVDFFYDTVGASAQYAPVVKRGGLVLSISTVPSGSSLSDINVKVPFIFRVLLNLANWYYSWRVSRVGAGYEYFFMHASGEELAELANAIEEGKLKPVVGKTARLDRIEDVRKGAQEVYDAKGGVGKFVIEIV